jgi:hypothetical protein
MAIIVHFVPRGMDHEKYAEVMRRLDAAGAGGPPRRPPHTT